MILKQGGKEQTQLESIMCKGATVPSSAQFKKCLNKAMFTPLVSASKIYMFAYFCLEAIDHLQS